MYLEQMDSSNTGLSDELDILLFNYWLTKSGIRLKQITLVYVNFLIVNE